jgi:hypothetical protein
MSLNLIRTAQFGQPTHRRLHISSHPIRGRRPSAGSLDSVNLVLAVRETELLLVRGRFILFAWLSVAPCLNPISHLAGI